MKKTDEDYNQIRKKPCEVCNKYRSVGITKKKYMCRICYCKNTFREMRYGYNKIIENDEL